MDVTLRRLMLGVNDQDTINLAVNSDWGCDYDWTMLDCCFSNCFGLIVLEVNKKINGLGVTITKKKGVWAWDTRASDSTSTIEVIIPTYGPLR